MADNVEYPIKRHYKTPWGWRLELDYGPKQGVTVVETRLPKDSEEQRKINRAHLEKVMRSFGREIVDWGRSYEEQWAADTSPMYPGYEETG